MTTSHPPRRAWSLALLTLTVTACATSPMHRAEGPGGEASTGVASGASAPLRVVQPGAPGQATRVVGPDELAVAGARLPHTAADVRFMQGMIPHHAQALEMSALVPSRTEREDIRLLARRIEISQKDEIAQMSRWLEVRGEAVPGEHAHHMMGDHALMPGMLSATDMTALRGARGDDFDRLFLELMIRHHEGAIIMVRELFESPGAGQEATMSVLSGHIEADQEIEIERMQRMLLARR